MAETEKKETEGEAEETVKPKKSKRKLIVFAVIGIVALALAGGGAFMLLGGKKHEEGEDAPAAEDTAHQDKGHDQPPVYLKLDTFTTNLAVEDNTAPGTAGQYIQVVVELKVEDAPSSEILKQYMPEIRNNILRLLSGRKPSQLASTEGKDLLANEIRDSVNNVASPGAKKSGKAQKGPVETVLFSSFIIQ